MRPLLLCTALASAGIASTPVAAQEASLWELLNPDRLMEQVMQFLVLSSRAFVDVTYADLSVSILDGSIAMEGLDLVLPAEITGARACPVRIDAVEVNTGNPLMFTALRGRVEMRGVEIAAACLPPEAALPVMSVLAADAIRIPEVTIDYTYDVPSGGFVMAMAARVNELAAVTVDADFEYLWVRQAPYDYSREEEFGAGPDIAVVGRLNRATVTVENLGGWEALSPILGSAMADPEDAAAFVTQTVGGMLEVQAGGAPVPKAAKAFVAELAEGWAAFVADPGTLVIETGFAADAPRTIDAAVTDSISENPLALFDLLEPVVGADRAAERNLLDAGLVRRAFEDAGSLSGEEAREVGLAMLTGARAPRNAVLASELLTPLAEAGDGDVALALARAERDPETAYAMALAAGPSGAAGLRGLLDGLERELPFATVLRLQGAAPEPGAEDAAGPASELRLRAEAHLRGVGAARSLRSSLFYATLAAARGDREALALLARIDAAVPGDAGAQWATVSDEVAQAATRAWLAE